MSIQIIGDFNTSVRKALLEIEPNLESLNWGVVLCGTHDPKNMDEMLGVIKYCRENDLPFLGLCWGMELMAIEYARNVMGIKDATSEESGPGTWVIEKLPELRVGIKPVGDRMESHWHNYGMTYEWAKKFVDFDIVLGDGCVEEMRLPRNLHHFGVQYHPEYQSSAKNPHHVLKRFIDICKSE